MNERIKELAKQAGIAVWGDAVYMYDPKDTLDSTVMAKFAELIVKDCARSAAMFSINKNDIHPDIKWDNMSEASKMVAHTTCQHVAMKIKEDFGVEE